MRFAITVAISRSAMDNGRYSLPLTLAATFAGCGALLLVWLVLDEPVAVATAFDRGDLAGLLELVGRTLASAAKALVRYL
jgi:hypothetical protein